MPSILFFIRFCEFSITLQKISGAFRITFWLYATFGAEKNRAKGFEIVDKPAFEKNYSGNALLTASRSTVKDTERIQRITAAETERLATLQTLAHSRRRW